MIKGPVIRGLVVFSLLILSNPSSLWAQADRPADFDLKGAAPSFDRLINNGELFTFKRDRGIERSDLAANYILRHAEERFRKGDYSGAIQLGKMAVQFSPASPFPHFFLAKMAWHQKSLDVDSLAKVYSEYFVGLKLAGQDFWFLFSSLATIILLMIVALFLTFVTFLLYTFLTLSALWVHQVVEWFRGYSYPVSSCLFFMVLLLMPLLFGIPVLWFFILSFFIFWGFYTWAERGIVISFLVGVGVSMWVFPFVVAFFTARNSPVLRQMVLNQQGEYLWSPPQLEPTGLDWKEWALLASYETQEGNYKKGEVLYQKALSLHRESGMLINNLGNIAFYLKDYPKAIKYYQYSLGLSPDLVSANYNMSQASQKMESFKEGHRKYLQEAFKTLAGRFDPKKAAEYARKTELFPNFPMIEERFKKEDLWEEVWKPRSADLSDKIWKSLAGKGSLRNAPVIAFTGFVLLAVSSFFMKGFYRARFCFGCHRAICHQCEHYILHHKVCSECESKFIAKEINFTTINPMRKRVSKRSYLLFLIPGGGHLALRRTAIGCLYLFLFYFFFGYIAFSEALLAHWHLDVVKVVIVPLCILLLYGISMFDLVYSRGRQ